MLASAPMPGKAPKGPSCLNDVFKKEIETIQARRDHAKTPKSTPLKNTITAENNLVGLAISGGGIRSSTFSLGVIQALAKQGVLRFFDYMSTVSGGGYTGSMLSALIRNPDDVGKSFPLKKSLGTEENAALQHLRNSSNYLAPERGLAILRLPWVYVRGLLQTGFCILSILMATILVTEMLYEKAGGSAEFINNLILGSTALLGMIVLALGLTRLRKRSWEWKNLSDLIMAGLVSLMLGMVLLIPVFNLILDAIDTPLNGPRGLTTLLEQNRFTLLWSLGLYSIVIGVILVYAPRNLSRLINRLALYLVTLSAPAFLFAVYLFLCVAQVDSPFIRTNQFESYLSSKRPITDRWISINEELRDTLETRGILYEGEGPIELPLIYSPKNQSERWFLARPEITSLAPPTRAALEETLIQFDGDPDSESILLTTPAGPLSSPADSSPPQGLFITVIQTLLGTEKTRYQNDVYIEQKHIDQYFYTIESNEILDPTTEERAIIEGINLPTHAPNRIINHELSAETRAQLASSDLEIAYKVANDIRVRSHIHPAREQPAHFLVLNPRNSLQMTGLSEETVARYTSTFPTNNDTNAGNAWHRVSPTTHTNLYPLLSKKIGAQEKVTPKEISIDNAIPTPTGDPNEESKSVPAPLRAELSALYPEYQTNQTAWVIFFPKQPIPPTIYLRRPTYSDTSELPENFFASSYHWIHPHREMETSNYYRLRKIDEDTNTFEIDGANLHLNAIQDCINFIGKSSRNAFVRFVRPNEAALIADGPFFLATLACLAFSWFFICPNRTSLHGFYRDRLSRMYLFRIKPDGEIDYCDTLKLSALNKNQSPAPYHLLNATLNLPGCSAPELRGRRADFFLFSRHFCGSHRTGYCDTDAMQKADPKVNLGTAMAISAAAAAPNMGTTTIGPLVMAMTLLNIRLSYWVPNPARVSKMAGPIRLTRLNPFYLIREALGWLNEKKAFVNVSDGGHIENLGIYELIRRKVRFIVAIDGEADPHMRLASLLKLIRYARIDHGVEITFPPGELERLTTHPETENQATWKHWAHATIAYSENQVGHLIYLKASLTGDEGPILDQFREQHPDFPHQTTSDQFFDEEQFEAYRELGEHIGHETLSQLAGAPIDDLPFRESLPTPAP